MDSIKRIYRACRAIIAELAPNTYFIPELMAALVTGIGWLSATIISGTIVNKHFKEENRAIRYLSLPLSNGERYATLLLINGIFVSIISFLPLVLVVILTYFLRPDSLLMPWPGYYAHMFLLGPTTMAFWLFPTIAYANKAWYAIIGVMVAFGIYITNTRANYSDLIDLDYTPTAFEATDVVGLSKYQFLEKQVTEVAFRVPDPESLQLVFAAIVATLMLFSAYLALTRKTA